MEFEKHLKITGSSNISWKDATVKTISEVSKTIDYLSNIQVLSQRADIQGDKIIKYYVDLDLTFIVDTNRNTSEI